MWRPVVFGTHLGFKRIGRVKGCGNLKSYPDELIDAIIYGRDLGPDGEDYVSPKNASTRSNSI